MIRVDDFHKAYESTVAVAGLSFCVGHGEILGLVGPNGAGKTTTLRALSGIIRASRGQLEVAGFDVDRQPLQAKANLAYVPDDPQHFSDLTVRQHLIFTASLYGLDDPTAKATQLLKHFELESKLDARASTLSRGMRQKLAIVCAYLHDPAAIFFDEPMTGLDPRGIRTFKDSVAAQAELGRSIIISSHLLAMVEDICSHLLILQDGVAQFFGSTDELRAAFAANEQQTSLEEIFFLATSETPQPSLDV